MEQATKHTTITAKFFFLSLGTLVALITSVSSFLTLAFEVLNKKFPDALTATFRYGYNTYEMQGIRGALSILIIAFPVFLILSYFWSKNSHTEDITHGDGVIRKWMIYLILFLTTVVVAVDLITLVRYFVSGEITVRFILKVLVTLAIGGIVGIYYLSELRSFLPWKRFNLYLAIKSSVLVLLLIIWSFSAIGSPMKQRDLRFDQRRVDDLQSLQSQIINYWQQKGTLPQELSDLANPISSYSLPLDPKTGEKNAYGYEVVSDKTFKLCATFALPMPKGWDENSSRSGSMPFYSDMGEIAVSSYPAYGNEESWDHESGDTCFTRTIDKDRYPVYKK